MSGVDEQESVPICPICKAMPAFWILYKDRGGRGYDGWCWLHSDEYLKEKPTLDKLVFMVSHDGRKITLDEVVVVVCRPNNIITGAQHQFTAESPIFQEVLRIARRLKCERNR